MYYNTVLDLIGNTPLVKISKLNSNPKVKILAKLEYINPGGSVKDRIGVAMIDRAEREGKLKKGSTIVEPTSGNTGVGLALVAALRGYRSVFVMPDKMSQEKRDLLRAYGGKVVITPTSVEPEDERSYYKVSDRLLKEIKNSYKPDQYHNAENPKAHYKTTGPEIWKQTEGKITHLVCGMGTGGTITGVGKYLKEKNPKIRIVGADPFGSIFYEYKKTGKYKDAYSYKVEGVGEDFIPSTIDLSLVDEIIRVGDKESFITGRQLTRQEGILAGGSAGLAMFAAQKLSKRLKRGLIVVIFPDSGKSYLSKMYNDDWMREHDFMSTEVSEEETVGEVLARKKSKKMMAVKPTDTVRQAVELMGKYDISQMPVISKGKILGKVTERQLLTELYKKSIGVSNKIASVVDSQIATAAESEPADRAAQLLSKDNLLVVIDSKNYPMGVLTRIDLIDYYT